MNKKIVDYVYELYDMRFPYYSKNVKKTESTKILYDICKSSKIKIYSVDEVTHGLADDGIVQMIEDSFKEKKNELWATCKNLKNHVIDVISQINFIENDDKDDYIINRIVANLVEFYDYRELVAGEYIEKVKFNYHRENVLLRCLLLENIRRVINSGMEIYESIDNNIPQSEIEIYVLNSLFPKFNYKMLMALRNGQYDEKVNKLVREYIVKNRKPKVNVTDYIARLIYNYDRTLSAKGIEYYTNKVEEMLRSRGLLERQITDEKEKQVILDCFDELKRRRNSIRETKKRKRQEEERIKYQTKKKKKQIIVITLATVGTLAVLVTSAILLANRNEEPVTVVYQGASNRLDGDRYKRLCTKYSDIFYQNACLVEDDYEKYCKLGEKYQYMGFFEFYMHVGENRLAIMDALLEYVNNNSEMNVGTSYYIQFMYDRLVELGCEEIKQDKYVNVINEYKDVAESNTQEDKTTMDCMNEKQIELIEEIRDLYIKNSAKCYGELADILNISSAHNTGSGRNV